MMLETVLEYLKNDFCVSIIYGEFTVDNGTLALPTAKDGQYVRIIGSVLNDGVYKVENGSVKDLEAESFTGTVRLLAIPKALLDLIPKIEEWDEKSISSPFQSESFADYRYDKGTSKSVSSWQDAFGKTLRIWRKL